MIFLFQRKILFNISGKPNKPENYELKNIKEIKIHTPDGIDLLAWYSRPTKNQLMLVYFKAILLILERELIELKDILIMVGECYCWLGEAIVEI